MHKTLAFPPTTIPGLFTFISSLLEPSLEKWWVGSLQGVGGGFPLPSPSSRSMYGGESRHEESSSAMLSDGWQALSVTELSQLKPLKVILLLILCGPSHFFLRETSDFHL